MKKAHTSSTIGKISLAVASMAILAGGVFLLSPNGAQARTDGRSVTIDGIKYKVKHDGDGPHIKVDGMKYYLEGKGDGDRYVVVDGMTYDVGGRGNH